MDEQESELSLGTLFTEPVRPPSPKPTFVTYSRNSFHARQSDERGQASLEDVNIRLVGSHPLWGHHLWNAAIAFAAYLDSNPHLIRDKFVLELGAGGALPGIIAAKNGARKVVLTDYPDNALIENMNYNVERNVKSEEKHNIVTQGYKWGQPVDAILGILPQNREPWRGFDLIILSDLIFNHSQHDALLQACGLCLTALHCDDSKELSMDELLPSVLVFYTHHRPHLAHRDLEFFSKARGLGWVCEEILTRKFPPMFPDDPGDERVRSIVHGWRLTR
ncbi:putative methyltransferase-domain-containing protein [Phlebopus sp. FC_14]|nr:putative methyltransferase-domain-containing protein [Phlebopus sp. FC_14]